MCIGGVTTPGRAPARRRAQCSWTACTSPPTSTRCPWAAGSPWRSRARCSPRPSCGSLAPSASRPRSTRPRRAADHVRLCAARMSGSARRRCRASLLRALAPAAVPCVSLSCTAWASHLACPAPTDPGGRFAHGRGSAQPRVGYRVSVPPSCSLTGQVRCTGAHGRHPARAAGGQRWRRRRRRRRRGPRRGVRGAGPGPGAGHRADVAGLRCAGAAPWSRTMCCAARGGGGAWMWAVCMACERAGCCYAEAAAQSRSGGAPGNQAQRGTSGTRFMYCCLVHLQAHKEHALVSEGDSTTLPDASALRKVRCARRARAGVGILPQRPLFSTFLSS